MGTAISGILGAFGLSASAGLNAYIPLLIVSLLAKFTDLIKLSRPWDALTSWWTIGVLAVLVLVEAVADKVPAVNHVNNAIQTFIRPTAGAIVFAASAGSVTEISPVLSLICGLLVAGTVHTVKSAAVRPLITATTAGTGGPIVSTVEDVVAALISVLSIVLPILMLIVLVLLIWALVSLIHSLKKPTREYN
ncbi:MAG TPA: DUF4126 domain-containing protein [Anaerolineaceae bacterium]|jgi:hypothetical protein|nr:DUF4126 domain-containing protein [Anaerolineales bacterium]HOG59295.1 DUF4126 domain-containing protein [Anaerolineaceae bacterium]HOR84395.1 DUF4126 domain-containing protein [Anaerolineaceae bacterium]HPL43290.1 DUF4126 domain-containing protein [Anaerolineaceae bacterium]HQK42121.1 DUF4126 domain-containing protein [Anaerolineaceae bacterium]